MSETPTCTVNRELAVEGPCRCHDSHADVVPFHSGHCCFFPADQDCHHEEVATWSAVGHQLVTIWRCDRCEVGGADVHPVCWSCGGPVEVLIVNGQGYAPDLAPWMPQRRTANRAAN